MSNDEKFPKLNDSNYWVWKVLMKAMLVRKNLWDVVDGSETRPSGSANTKAVRSFNRKQAEAVAEITLALDSSQLSFISSDDPKEVWDYLTSIHLGRGVATRLTLRRRFNRLEKSASESMQTFISFARRLAAQLREVGATVEDEDLILAITGGLPRSYSTFIVTLDSTPADDLTLDYVVSRLLNEELRQVPDRANRDTVPPIRADPDNVAMAVAAASRIATPLARITCFKCGNKGHYQINCPDTKEGDSVNVAYSADASEDDGVWLCEVGDSEDER